MKRDSFRIACRLLAACCACFYGRRQLGANVRPVVNELGNPAKGRVEYVNDGMTPLNVVLEARALRSRRPAKSAIAHSTQTFT